jgi:RNA polymerase sigma-70 factor (ECF subfamily)
MLQMASASEVYSPPSVAPPLDAHADSRAWLAALRSEGAAREEAVRRLHALLLRAARFELGRRRAALADVRLDELDDLAVQATDDALAAILAKLDSFRGASRFTTWAYKFVLLETATRVRRRAWQGREVVLEPERWPELADPGASPHELVEARERLDALRRAVDETLTTRQREVFAAVALNGVPIDVLAERLGSTRGAIYKTLHDARRKLRAQLEGTP